MDKTLPPIKLLFKDSYTLLKSVFAPLLVFNILVLAISSAAFLIIFIGFILLFIALGVNLSLSGLSAEVLLGAGVSLTIGVIIFTILIAIMSSIGSIGSILIFNEANPKVKVFETIKRSAKFIIPLLLNGIVMTFLVMGGYFLFIIPGIVFGILFVFSQYIIITENKGPVESLKRSMNIVMKNFSAIFLRLLALWGLSLLISIIFTILSSILKDESTSGVITILNFIANIAFTWFSIAYILTLFKQLQKTKPTGISSLKIPTIIAVVGWIIGIFVLYTVARAVPFIIESIIENQKEIRQELTPEEQRAFDELLEETNDNPSTEEMEYPTIEDPNESTTAPTLNLPEATPESI